MKHLQTIIPGKIWCSQYPVQVGPLKFSSRTTLVKLSSDILWVHSPCPLCKGLVNEITELGEVGYIIAPNLTHNYYYEKFLEAFPKAHGYFAPGTQEKLKTSVNGRELNSTELNPWLPELESVFIAGLPVLNETVWFHDESGSLILTDLLFCFGRENSILIKIAAKILGVYEKLNMSRTMKRSIQDFEAFNTSIAKIQLWDVKRVILAHDQVIEIDSIKNIF